MLYIQSINKTTIVTNNSLALQVCYARHRIALILEFKVNSPRHLNSHENARISHTISSAFMSNIFMIDVYQRLRAIRQKVMMTRDKKTKNTLQQLHLLDFLKAELPIALIMIVHRYLLIKTEHVYDKSRKREK